MVVHESAFHRFAELELVGETENSLVDVVAELHWPLGCFFSAVGSGIERPLAGCCTRS
jgi:hypothetical protein